MPTRKRSTKKAKEMRMEMDMSGCNGCGRWHGKGCMGGAYSLGFIGALVYYIQTATGFWSGVLGILKAIVWPAFLVYKLLGM